ncbi:MAG: hypothetical protein NXI32_27970, partial [bacterium]|nr:hypothetical protein [bacterium]
MSSPKSFFQLVLLVVLCSQPLTVDCSAQDTTQPLAERDLVFAEKDGLVAVEAEHFVGQTQTELRAFYLVTSKGAQEISPDGDPVHLEGASSGAYLEVLPDSRRNHSEKLIAGENFSNEPGKLAVLTYQV